MRRIPVTKVASLWLAVHAAILDTACSTPDAPAARSELPVAWTLTDEPVVTIGGESGSAATFESVDGVRVDARGRILVMDGGAAELRAFDAAGSHLATFGGEGEGPGEYEVPRLLGLLRGDSAAVLDRVRQTVTYVSARGEYGRSHALVSADQPRPIQALGVLGDGRVVVQFLTLFRGPLPDGAVLADTMELSVMDPVTGELEVLGLAGSQAFVWTRDDQVPLPFAPRPALSIRGDTVFALDASGSRIVVYAPDGSSAVWSTPRMPEPVTAADRERYARAAEERTASADRLRALIDAAEHPAVPSVKPIYDALVAGAYGEIWARLWGEGAEERVWDVFAPSGRVRGTVVTPANLQVAQVTPDGVVGVRRDALNVPSIRVYGLRALGL